MTCYFVHYSLKLNLCIREKLNRQGKEIQLTKTHTKDDDYDARCISYVFTLPTYLVFNSRPGIPLEYLFKKPLICHYVYNDACKNTVFIC